MTATDHHTTPPRTEAGRPSWLPVAVVVGLAGVMLALRAFADPNWYGWLPNVARDLLTLSVSVFLESLPFVFLGIGVSILVQHWLPETWWERLLPRAPFLRRIVLSLMGVFFPVCECGNVPMARGLMLRGLGVGEVLTFLLAAPILNPVTIITTYQAFGFDDGILVGRVLGAFVIANLVGWVVSRHPSPTSLLTPSFEARCRTDHDDHSHGTRWQRSAAGFAEETSVMLPALVLGCLLAGLIQVGVSRETLISLGNNPIASVLVLMTLGFVVSVCSNVDAFFILAFGATFLPGSITAFLIFGAMIDIKLLSLLRTTFTAKALGLVTAIVGLATLVIGLGMNLAG